MGRPTSTYRVEYRDNTPPLPVVVQDGRRLIARLPPLKVAKVMAWDCRQYGRPTARNLETWRCRFNESFAPKGVNWHVTKALGVQLAITSARIVHRATGEVVAETRVPMS